MNTSKFSLADLLTVLGALIFGYCCFLSFNFLLLGETIPSIVWSIGIAVILGGLAFGVKLLKITSKNFKIRIIWESILLLLFFVAAIIAVRPFSHYFAVKAQRETIQQKLIANITQAEGMFVAYEEYAKNRENTYKNYLNSAVEAKVKGISDDDYLKYGFNNITPVPEQTENKIFILHKKLFPSNFTEMKKADSTWLVEAKKAVQNWKPLGVVPVVNDVKGNVEKWRNDLIQFSKYKPQGMPPPIEFPYPLNFNVVTDQFENIGNPTILSITIAIGLYLLMLLSYFVSKRHTRYPGLKVIFTTGKAAENEL